MIDKKMLARVNDKIQANPEALVKEIEEELKWKKVYLTEIEKKRILRILQNKFFREIVLMTIQKEYKRRDIDAASEISNILGVSAIVPYLQFRATKKNTQKLAAELNQSYDGTIGFEYREYNSSDPVENFLNYLGPNLPEKLIRLLPVDLERIFDIIEETAKRIQMNKK